MPCAVCRPISISPNISNFTSSTWRCLYKLEPSHHWVIIASWGLNVHPINNNIFTCLVFLKSKGSILLKNRWCSFHIRYASNEFNESVKHEENLIKGKKLVRFSLLYETKRAIFMHFLFSLFLMFTMETSS